VYFNQMKLKFKQLTETAKLPVLGSEFAAGLDLFSDTRMLIPPGNTRAIGTGVAVEIPVGFEGQVRPRSGLAKKYGITVLNTPGTIDSDYRGEIVVLLHNTSSDTFPVSQDDRVAQLVICPVIRVTPEFVDELSDSDRGEGGFGSTGR
jgi:dUTP pyrophosphatase